MPRTYRDTKPVEPVRLAILRYMLSNMHVPEPAGARKMARGISRPMLDVIAEIHRLRDEGFVCLKTYVNRDGESCKGWVLTQRAMDGARSAEDTVVQRADGIASLASLYRVAGEPTEQVEAASSAGIQGSDKLRAKLGTGAGKLGR